MSLNLKKVWPLAAASLLSITSLVQADSDKGGACNNPFVPATNPEMLGVINPNARPNVDCARATFTAEILYWNAHEDGLEYGIDNTEAPNLANNQVSVNHSSPFYNGDLLNPDRKWEYGFRFGFGYVLTHDGWDVNAAWTHYRTNASDAVSADSTTTTSRIYTLFSAMAPGAGDIIGGPGSNVLAVVANPIAEQVDTSWKLHLDLVDLELGREFYTSKYLTLRPHMGLRGASIRQSYDITYMGGSFSQQSSTSGSTILALTDEVTMEDNFWSIGVRGGLNSEWHWTRGCGGDWSFYGNVALSLIYGRFSVDQNERIIDVDTFVDSIVGGEMVILDVENNFHATRAMTDLALGLRYDYDCTDSNYHIALWLGWEHHIAFGMNQWARYSSILGTGHSAPTSPSTYTIFVPEDGDLTTQGWTLGFGLDF